jgi:hypothetical protein
MRQNESETRDETARIVIGDEADHQSTENPPRVGCNDRVHGDGRRGVGVNEFINVRRETERQRNETETEKVSNGHGKRGDQSVATSIVHGVGGQATVPKECRKEAVSDGLEATDSTKTRAHLVAVANNVAVLLRWQAGLHRQSHSNRLNLPSCSIKKWKGKSFFCARE